MPRLRRLKKELTYEELFPDVPNRRDEPTDEDGSGELVQSGSISFEPPRGWWSNENVIASMSDAALREACNRYELLAKICRQEMDSRAIANAQNRRTSGMDIRVGHRVFKSVQRASVQRRSDRRRNELKLTSDQMVQALQLLMKMKEARRVNHAEGSV